MISVIMSVFNNEKTIEKSLLSLLEGSYKDIEIIIVNDGSTDSSEQIIREIQKRYSNVVLINNDENKGIPYSLNLAIKNAKGEYIARNDGDDYSSYDRLEKQLNYLNKHTEYDFVCTSCFLYDFDKGVYGTRNYKEIITKNDLIKFNPFIHPTLLIKKSTLLEVNGYQDSIDVKRCEDYDLFFRLYLNSFKGVNMQEELYFYYEDTKELKIRTREERRIEHRLRDKYTKLLNIKFPLTLYKYKPLLLMYFPKFIYRFAHKKLNNNNLEKK